MYTHWNFTLCFVLWFPFLSQFKKMSLAVELAGGVPVLMEEMVADSVLLDNQSVVMNYTEVEGTQLTQSLASGVQELLTR